MSRRAVVLSIDRERSTAEVAVYPESCGRCGGDGGHCARDRRMMTASCPADAEIDRGESVQLVTPPAAIRRAVTDLLVLPAAAAGLTFVAVTYAMPGWSSGIRVALGAVFGALPLALALIRGRRPKDRPIVAPISVDER